GLERRDRPQPAPSLVPDREAIQEILDGGEADALEVGGTTRADAFQELNRSGQDVVGLAGPRGSGRGAHCTIMAWPRSTWISRMRAGRANGSSRPMPDGLSGVRE